MKKFLKVFLISFGLVLLVGCGETVEEKLIESIDIDQTSLSELHDVRFFSIEDLELIVYYTDQTFEKIQASSYMLSSTDLEKLEIVGEQTIEVFYGGESIVVTIDMINENIFDVTLDSNGGSYIRVVEALYGETIQLPEEPTLEGHQFIVWYQGEKVWNFEEDIVTEDLVLTAKWEKNTYEVTLMEDEITVLETLSGEYGDTINYDTTPSREGYTFEGWYTDVFTFENNAQFPFELGDDVILYAKWELIPLMTLNWNIGGEPFILDPGLNGASDGGDVINNTFEGLVREKNGVILPGMADSWVVSEDGLTVTFHIRDDAKWSDGTPVTADDFVRSWKRGMDPRNQSEYAWIWEYTNIVGANEFAFTYSNDETELDNLASAVGIESQNDGATLVVTLTTPTDWFVSFMAFYHFMPVPESATINGYGAWAKDPETAISNGPFILSEFTVGEGLQLVKNEYYWNAEEVRIEVINGYFIDLSTTAYSKYYAGELDVNSIIPTAEIPGLMAASDEFYVFPWLGTYFVNFNLSGCEVGGTRDIGDRDNDIFCNENLRKALSLSINRDEITEALALGISAEGLVSFGFLDQNGEDFSINTRDYSEIAVDDSAYALAVTYFQTAAIELYPEAANTAAAVALLQSQLETKSYYYNTSEGHRLVAEMMQDMWEENLGFTIQVTNEEWALFQATRDDGDFDLTRGGWLTDYMDPYGMFNIFVQGNPFNYSDYYSAAFETKIEEARTATTSEDHYTALYEAYQILMEDMPVIPIYHYSDSILVKSYVTGWSRSVLGPIDFSTASVEAVE